MPTILDFARGMKFGKQEITERNLLDFVSSMNSISYSAKGIASKIVTTCFPDGKISIIDLFGGKNDSGEITSALQELEDIYLVEYVDVGIIALNKELRNG